VEEEDDGSRTDYSGFVYRVLGAMNVLGGGNFQPRIGQLRRMLLTGPVEGPQKGLDLDKEDELYRAYVEYRWAYREYLIRQNGIKTDSDRRFMAILQLQEDKRQGGLSDDVPTHIPSWLGWNTVTRLLGRQHVYFLLLDPFHL
jgi:hypothetical protein